MLLDVGTFSYSEFNRTSKQQHTSPNRNCSIETYANHEAAEYKGNCHKADNKNVQIPTPEAEARILQRLTFEPLEEEAANE